MTSLTIAEIEQTPFQTVPAQTITADACAQVGPDAAIIVAQDESGRLLGVLPPDEVASLVDSQLPLDHHRSLCQPPTFVLPSTLVADTLQAMRYDKSIRWLVVLEGGKAARLVSPETLFAVSRSAAALQSDARLAAAVYGDPVSDPPGLCYLCSAEPAHTIPPERVEDRTADGQALCPCDHTPMVGSFVCPQEFSPC